MFRSLRRCAVVRFNEWLTKHGPTLKPPVANKLLYDSNLKVMVVGGPNQRSDYHIQTGEEFFVQLQGELVVKIIERGTFRDVTVRAGETFLLPSHVPHSPQRSAGSIGLVFERSHTPDEMDGMVWFSEATNRDDGASADLLNTIDYEEYFHCVDLGTQLKPIIERYLDFKKQHLPPRREEERPIDADSNVLCGAVRPFTDLIHSRQDPQLRSLHRGDEVLCDFYQGPCDLDFTAAPYDIFLWQLHGKTSPFQIRGISSSFLSGDVTLLSKGDEYHGHLATPEDRLLAVANVYT